jgi:hypothetical protein
MQILPKTTRTKTWMGLTMLPAIATLMPLAQRRSTTPAKLGATRCSPPLVQAVAAAGAVAEAGDVEEAEAVGGVGVVAVAVVYTP